MKLIFKISLFIALCVTCSFLNSSCKKEKDQCFRCTVHPMGSQYDEPDQTADTCDPTKLQWYKWNGYTCVPL
jgi:hypothetical protein